MPYLNQMWPWRGQSSILGADLRRMVGDWSGSGYTLGL
jgi:hypothetical protein